MSEIKGNKTKEKEYYDIKYGLATIGNSNVGKHSLITRYTKSQADKITAFSLGIDIQSKIIQIENKKIKIEIIYSPGQERFRIFPKKYFNNQDGIILIYDITDKDSFEQIISWIKDIKNHNFEKIKLILVGNKCDLNNERKVSIDKGQNLAKLYNIKFFEASAKEGTNVEELFSYIINEIYQENNPNKNTLTLKNDSSKSKKNKCA